MRRLEALLAHARHWADAHHPAGRALRARLRETSVLSSEGLELALAHLETEVSLEASRRLQERAALHGAPVVHVLLAGNVCVAALRAVVFALACAPRVEVRPSRRDPALAEAIAGACPDVTLVSQLAPAPNHGVHLYGSDATLRELSLPGRALRFGSGIGVAAVRGVEEVPMLMKDLVAFDGAGCISPRLLVAEHPRQLLEALHGALETCDVPRGALTDDDRAALTRARRTYAAIGAWAEGQHHALALDPAPQKLSLLPPLRAAVVVPADTLERWLPTREITMIAGEGPIASRLAAMAPRARRAALGSMQRPPLDGPVDLRPLA